MRLLHVSDPHFGTEQAPVVQALIRLARTLQPDLAVLSGDITQRARRDQFEAARQFMNALGVPRRLAITGNHDIPLWNLWARCFHPYANFRRAFGELQPSYSLPELLVVSVNTTRRYRHKNGEVSARQIEDVSQRLQDASPAQLRVVVIHQPIAVPRAQDEHDRLRGHVQATGRWSEAGADLVLGGHIHLPYVLALHEQVPGLRRRMWAVQAGTAVSRRVREGVPNSVNLIRWGDGLPTAQGVVERWDYADSSDSFVKHAEHRIETGPLAG